MQSQRLQLIDLLRFVSFLAIGIHHFAWIFWYTRDVPPVVASQTYTAYMQLVTETYARSLSFSGFTIVGLASFLQAFSRQEFGRRVFLFSFLLLGWGVFCVLITQETGFYPGWDVYPLLFSGLIFASFAERISHRALKFLGFTGYILLLIPFWKFTQLQELPFFIRHVLVGVCENDLADWPVLPWVGLVWMCYWFGSEVKRKLGSLQGQWNLTQRELWIWILLLTAGATQFGKYFGVPLGKDFPCFVYRQEPYVFWGHFVWILFIVRAAFDSRVKLKIQNNVPLQWICRLAITRHFWLAYIIHYCLAYLFNNTLDALGGEANWWYIHAVALIYALFFPTVELLTRGALLLFKNAPRFYRYILR